MKTIQKKWLFIIAASFVMSFSFCVYKGNTFVTPIKPKLLWVSLDGLRFEDFQTQGRLLKQGHPFGLNYLLSKKNWNSHLQPVTPSQTSVSHISTITCSMPGSHGIYGNVQWDGKKIANGFLAPYKTETFIEALRKQGLKVGSIAYPTVDGTEPRRSATFGVAYDDGFDSERIFDLKKGANQVIKLVSRVDANDVFEVHVSLLNSEHTIVAQTVKNTKVISEIKVEVGKIGDLVLAEDPRLQIAHIFPFTMQNDVVKIAVSQPAIAAAYGVSFQKLLEKNKLVFPTFKSNFLQLGGDAALITVIDKILNFFKNSTLLALEKEDFDALFLYINGIDILGHSYGTINNSSEYWQSFFLELDQALGEIIKKLPPETDVVVVGDHGMAANRYVLNPLALLPDAIKNKVRIVVRGGTLMVYGKESLLESQPPIAEKWFKDMHTYFEQAIVDFDNNAPVFEKIIVKNTSAARAFGVDGDKMPWLIGLTYPGIRLKNEQKSDFVLSIAPDVKMPQKFVEKYLKNTIQKITVKSLGGDHGHLGSRDEMATALLLFGPHLNQVNAASIMNSTQIVPAVADALLWPRPAGCLN